MMRALIVDDEIYSREEMAALLQETGAFVICGKCANAIEAMRAIQREKPDVLFLDVQMPVLGGFELLSMIDEKAMPNVVFVTAHDEYALKAFEENALDYLLKPVEKERLSKTVEKLRKRAAGEARPVLSGPELSKIPCLTGAKIRLINTGDVEYVRSDETGLHVVCPAGEFYTELTLQVLEGKTKLVRCHKQYLVNMDRVEEIVLRDNLLADIRTKSGRLVPVSRRYLRLLREQWHF